MSMLICPGCGTAVPATSLIGHVRYDRVVAWQDDRCSHAWPRFTEPGPLHDAGVQVVASFNLHAEVGF